MNYEEKYNEILEWARKNKARLNGVPIEEVLPELAESEDERIRKWIITELKDSLHEIETMYSGDYDNRDEEDKKRQEYLNKALTYLEKQKAKEKQDRMMPVYNDRDSFESALDKAWKSYNESGARTVDSCEDDYVECAHAKGFREGFLFGVKKQKENPKSIDSISSDCISDAICEDRWHKVTDSLPDNGRLVLAKDCLGNVLLARYDGENWEVNVYDNEDHYCHNSISKWCEIPSEKQKEQKPEWSEEDWKLLDEVREHIIGVTGDKPDLTPNKIYDGFLDLIDRLKFAKPQLKQEWSKEDKDVIDEASELALGWGCPNLSAKLKSILSRVKPAEWSEEDQKSLNRAINICISDFGEESETARFLKSLPGRFNLQPKVEWSEEDERMLSRCIKSVEYSKQFADSETYKAAKDKEIAWLKSLKPQSHSEWRHYIWAINMRFDYTALIKYDNTDNYEIVQAGNRPKQEKNGVYILIKDIKPQSSWKPSEEQMGALNYAYCELFKRGDVGHNILGPLQKLCDELKKLM